MTELIEIIVYPFQKVVLLLFSMQIGNMTVGSLMIAAVIIGSVFRLLIGQHMVQGIWSAAGSISDRVRSKRKGGSSDAD